MFHLSEQFLGDLGMKFQDILPLVEETYRKAIELNPSQSQTGPAIRKDEETIQRHLDMIKDEILKHLYSMITESIQERS